MSLSDAKRLLQWKVVAEALSAAGVDDETLKIVDHAREVSTVIHSLAMMLQGGANTTAAKNYVKVEMVGLIPPFDRAYVELARPGGKTSHELRELLRDRLVHVRDMLAVGPPNDGLRDGLIRGIDEDLTAEAP